TSDAGFRRIVAGMFALWMQREHVTLSPRNRDGEAALDSAFELHDDRTNVGSMTRHTQIRCTRAAVSRGTLRIRSSRPSPPESWASLRSAQPTRSRRSATTRRLAGPVIGDPPVFTFVIPR